MVPAPSHTYPSPSHDLLLAPGTRVLHIGPFKTGTSALQGAFCQARDEFPKHDVIYPAGALRHWLRPTIALTGASSIRGHPKAEPRHWQQLVDAFDEAGDATVLHSCEFFSDCEPEQIDRAVRELGRERPVHVVITVRPLARILPSQWQMHIQDGWIHTPYEEWLRQVFDDAPIEPGDPTERFWHRHDHARLAARWAEAVGPENVTVIVADPHDRHALLRPFEAMLGLPTGFLEFEPGHVNESLHYGGTEVLRNVNGEFARQGWSDDDYGRLIRHGATARMRAEHEPLPVERPTRTPAWAQQRAIESGNRIADRLGEIGVRVAGDLDHLRIDPGAGDSREESTDGNGVAPPSVTSDPSDALVAAGGAAQFAIGILERQQEHTTRLREDLAEARKRAERAEHRLGEEREAKQRLADELAAARKLLTPAHPEQRRAIDVGSLSLLRFVARRLVRRLRRPRG